MKPIYVDLVMPVEVMDQLKPLHDKVTADKGTGSIVMLQVYEDGFTRGFWIPPKLADKAVELGTMLVKQSKEA